MVNTVQVLDKNRVIAATMDGKVSLLRVEKSAGALNAIRRPMYITLHVLSAKSCYQSGVTIPFRSATITTHFRWVACNQV